MASIFSAECPICEEWKYTARINLPRNHDYLAPCPNCGFILHFTPELLSESMRQELKLPSDFRRKEWCLGEISLEDYLEVHNNG